MNSIYFSLYLLLAVFTLASGAPKECGLSEQRKADECFRTMIVYGDRSRNGWPTDLTNYEATCLLFRDKHQCVKSYAKRCLSSFSQQITGLLLRGLTGTIKDFCAPKVNREQMLKHTKCGNSDLSHDHDCLDEYVKTLKGTMNLPQEKRMTMNCCAFHTFQRCILLRMENNKALCSKSDLQLYRKVITGFVGDAMDLACSSYKEGSKICIEQEKLADGIKTEKGPGKSPLLPLISILNSI